MAKKMMKWPRHSKRLTAMRLLLVVLLLPAVATAYAALPVDWKPGELAAAKGSWSLNTSGVPAISDTRSKALLETKKLVVRLYSYNSRLPLGPVSIRSLEELQVIDATSDPEWLTVRVNSGFPGWVSVADVIVNDEQVMQVSAPRTRLYIEPQFESRYLLTLNKEYQAPVLSIEGEWLQTLAPSSMRLRMKKADYEALATPAVADSGVPVTTPGPPARSPAVPAATIANTDQTSPPVPITPERADTPAVIQPVDLPRAAAVSNTAAAVPSASPPSSPIASGAAGLAAQRAAAASVDYRLTPGDVISISVFGEPDMAVKEQRIPENGLISFPLIGGIDVRGRTPLDVQNDVKSKLAAGYLRDPEVNLTIDRYRPLYVRGAVIGPGAYDYTEGLTVTKVLALAGGVGKEAIRDAIKLYRNDQLFLQNLTVDSQVLVRPGDTVVVDQADETLEEANRFVYLHGEVNNPGGYPYRRGLTVEKAVALAGGFGPRASRKKITISREVIGEQKPERLTRVELYEDLQPGDVISIGASWF